MRPALRPFAAVMLCALFLCGCGGATVDALENEAAECPELPGTQVADLAPGALVLNAYYLQEDAAYDLRADRGESPAVEEVFAKASAMGARAIRTNGFNDGVAQAGSSAIQVGPGEYDELGWRALDLVLTRAQAHGLRLILPLGNSWDAYGGARRYVGWAGLPDPIEADPRFFTDEKVIALYERHLTTLLSRVNTQDGIRYGDHPAVLAWELLNEPRGAGADPRALRAWSERIGALVKRLSPGHLVSTGEEGFENPRPVKGQVARSQSFELDSEAAEVDLGSVHLYPEAWGWSKAMIPWGGARWLTSHARRAARLHKPLVLGEFGLPNTGRFSLEERRAIYRGWLRCAHRLGVGLVAPWLFANDARPDGWDDYTFYFRDGSTPADPANRYVDVLLDSLRSGR